VPDQHERGSGMGIRGQHGRNLYSSVRISNREFHLLARQGLGSGSGSPETSTRIVRTLAPPSNRPAPALPNLGWDETPIEPLGVSPLPDFGYCTPYPTAGLPFSCSLPADHSNPRVSRSSTAGSCSV